MIDQSAADVVEADASQGLAVCSQFLQLALAEKKECWNRRESGYLLLIGVRTVVSAVAVTAVLFGVMLVMGGTTRGI
jgi:hypothetical protein